MTTKFDIGESVWVLHEDRIQQAKIIRIHPIQTASHEITWSVVTREDIEKVGRKVIWEDKLQIGKLESKIFKTKQELIDSL